MKIQPQCQCRKIEEGAYNKFIRGGLNASFTDSQINFLEHWILNSPIEVDKEEWEARERVDEKSLRHRIKALIDELIDELIDNK